MLKKHNLIILLLALTLLITSCQKPAYIQQNENANDIFNKGNDESVNLQESKIEISRPERNLSLSFAFNNTSLWTYVYNDAVYYTNNGGFGILRYIDPKTGFSEILCKDPLCSHAGDKSLCLANMWFFEVHNIISDGKNLYVYAIKDQGMFDNLKSTWKEKKHGIYKIDLKNNNFQTITEWKALDGRLIPIMKIQDEYIYYSRRTAAENNYNKLYRMKKTGDKEEQLCKTDIAFNNFEINGDEIYYTSMDNILYKSDFSMKNSEKIAENVTYFTLKGNYVYIGYEIYEAVYGSYKGSRKGTLKCEVRRITLDDFNDIQYICTTSSGMPIFDETRYYYLPHEPVNTAKYVIDDIEYDVLNSNNGKIVISDIETNKIIKTYQDTSYFGFKLFYADENTLLIAAGDIESGEVLNRVCVLYDDKFEYYDVYEDVKGEYSLYN